MTRHVQSVSFGEDQDGNPMVQIIYVDTDNVRVQGQVVLMTSLEISLVKQPDYAADADLVLAQARRLLNNVLDDFHDSAPYVPEDNQRDEDSGMGMGFGDQS